MPTLGWSTGCFRATLHPYALGQVLTVDVAG